jgi:hypothetical protein
MENDACAASSSQCCQRFLRALATLIHSSAREGFTLVNKSGIDFVKFPFGSTTLIRSPVHPFRKSDSLEVAVVSDAQTRWRFNPSTRHRNSAGLPWNFVSRGNAPDDVVNDQDEDSTQYRGEKTNSGAWLIIAHRDTDPPGHKLPASPNSMVTTQPPGSFPAPAVSHRTRDQTKNECPYYSHKKPFLRPVCHLVHHVPKSWMPKPALFKDKSCLYFLRCAFVTGQKK